MERPQNTKVGLRIGIDCHGTLLDTRGALKRYAKRKYQLSIPPGHLSREQILAKGHLRPDEYELIAQRVFVDRAYVPRHVPEADDATRTINQLMADGHQVTIITASGPEAHISLLHWLVRRDLYHIPTLQICRGCSKADYARLFDVTIDDDPDQVVALVRAGVTYVYLFSHEVNASFNEKQHGIIRVDGFQEFYKSVSEIPVQLGNFEIA